MSHDNRKRSILSLGLLNLGAACDIRKTPKAVAKKEKRNPKNRFTCCSSWPARRPLLLCVYPETCSSTWLNDHLPTHNELLGDGRERRDAHLRHGTAEGPVITWRSHRRRRWAVAL